MNSRVTSSKSGLSLVPKSAPFPQPSLRPSGHSQIHFNGIRFCSLSEAVCGTLMELYVPGFKVIEGETFQIPLGQGAYVDFLVHGILFEFHGIRLNAERGRFGDFESRAAYLCFSRQIARLKGKRFKREKFIAETRARLLQRYTQRRQSLICKSDKFCNLGLVVASSSDQFYDLIIRRFNKSFCPTRSEFNDIFYALVKVVARQNFGSKRRVKMGLRA